MLLDINGYISFFKSNTIEKCFKKQFENIVMVCFHLDYHKFVECACVSNKAAGNVYLD